MPTPRTNQQAWYKQPLVWMLIAIPFSAVIMGVIMIRLAVSTEDGLIVDDYYRYGKEINRVLERDRAAAALGLDGVISLEPQSGAIQLTLNRGIENEPKALNLRLLHATRQGFDQTAQLSRTAPGRYGGELDKPLAPGHWKLELGTPTWRITGRMRAPQQRSVRLKALM